MIIGNMNLSPSLEDNMAYSQNYLIQLCEERNIDYVTGESREVVKEDVVSRFYRVMRIFKKIFNMAIKAIVGIFQIIWDVLKNIWNAIVSSCERILEKKPERPKKEVIPVAMSGIKLESALDINTSGLEAVTEALRSANLINKRGATKKEIADFYMSVIKDMSNKVKAESIKSAAFIKRFEQEVNRSIKTESMNIETMTDESVEESFILMKDIPVLEENSEIDEKAELIEKSKSLVANYNAFCSYNIEDLVKQDDPDINISNQLLTNINNLKETLPESSSNQLRFLQETYIPTIDKDDAPEAMVRRWVTLKINYTEGIKQFLLKMIKYNYRMFKLDMASAEE